MPHRSWQTPSWTRIAPKPNKVTIKMQYLWLTKYLRCWNGYNTKSQTPNLLLNMLQFLSFILITIHIFAGMSRYPIHLNLYAWRGSCKSCWKVVWSATHRYSAGTEFDVEELVLSIWCRTLPRTLPPPPQTRFEKFSQACLKRSRLTKP